MGFFSGFTTGLAKSIDDTLKKDMERTQERMDGMEQYRVTRRRARIEKQEKDKEELRDVLTNLGSLVEGDEDKAIQLYKAGGGTLSGGTELYKELFKNQQAGKDITAALTFAEVAEPGDFTSFISRNVTPVTALPSSQQEQMKGSGLYGKLFDRDYEAELSARVDEAAPLAEVPEGPAYKGQAKIDRSSFLAAEEAAELAKSRERDEGRYVMEKEGFVTAQAKAQQSMDLATRAADRLDKLDKENASQQDIENARADLASAREQSRLDLAVAAAERDAQAFITSQELQGVTLEQRQLELKKAKEAPQFSTYEAMLVASDQKIATLESIPEAQKTSQQKRDLADATAIRNKALAGIKSVADAESTTTYTPSFSKQSVDSIINSEIKRQLEPVGLVKDIEGQITYKIKGNEVQYFDRMNRALDNVELRVGGLDDDQMNNTIAAQRASLAADAASYINKKLATKGFQAKTAEDITVGTGQDQVTLTGEEALIERLANNEYKAGDIIQFKDENGVIQNILWTGSQIL